MAVDKQLALAELSKYEILIDHHLRQIEREGNVSLAKLFHKRLGDLKARAKRTVERVQK